MTFDKTNSYFYNLKILLVMFKLFRTLPLAALAIAGVSTVATAGVADSYPVPASDAQGIRGATMPYTRYDCNEAGDATLSGGATLKTSPNWDASNKATQASHQAYVDMPVGSTLTWKVKTPGDGVTVRYTIADKNVGGEGKANGYASKEGGLEFYVNGQKAGEVDLTSYYMYQYFSSGSGSPNQNGGTAPCFCFDEKHVRLNRMLNPGDELMVKCTGGEEVGVDFVELEVVPDALDPNDDANGRQVFDVTAYGAKADVPSFDNRSAFEKAFNAASAAGGIMYIPEGTWYMGHNGQGGHGILSLSGKNVKVMGAGIWYTNIQFTGWDQFGGGISGGNPSNTGGKSDMDNIEWCHMYINSNLSDRHGENAVYKCFMDIWCAGSAMHDIWEQHFECGFWFGDYNNANKKSQVVLFNNRIRDNYADGVNFCRGTSNSAVFNCSIRNNGDDGLACWDDPALGSQTGNTFAYNTIDFIWRAGAIAIYGGTNQRAYNNYIVDTFMASGMHVNSVFSRGTIDDVVFENNWLVRAGTLWECWGRDYAAIDLEGSDKGVVFRNNHLWDCPAEAIRARESSALIDGLYVNGAGISGEPQSYSASPHSAGLGNVQPNSVTIKNMWVVEGSVPKPTVGADLNQYSTWPWWDTDPGQGTSWNWISAAQADAEGWLDAPEYPLAQGVEPPVNVFETMTDYNFVMTGLDWITNQDKHSMYQDDQVTFKVRIDYKGKEVIEEGTKVALTVDVDGKNSFSYTIKDEWQPNSYKIVELPTPWVATLGEHTFTAILDPAGKMLYETNKADNSRSKDVNVKEIPEGEEPEIEIPTHSGKDMGVVKVYFENLTGDQEEFKVGDKLMPHAIVANYGSETITLGSGQGVLWALGGSPEYNTGMLWDDATHTIKPGEWIDVTPNGGGNESVCGFSDWTYTVKAESVDLWCRMDSPSNYNDNNADNNSLYNTFTYPTQKPVYNDNPDRADNLLTGGYWDYEDGEGSGDVEVTGYDLAVVSVSWTPGDKEINTGDEIKSFQVRVDNKSNVALPAGKTVRVNFYVDGETKGTATYTDGIAPQGFVVMDVPGSYVATAGGHTVKAVVSNISGELTYDNNSRERTFNAIGGNNFDEPATTYLTGFSEAPVQGRSLVIRSISWSKPGRDGEGIHPGDQVVFSAVIVNNGTEATPDIKHGLLFEYTGNGGYDPKFWCDQHKTGLQPGETATLTCNDGTNGVHWTATEGISTFRVMLDDQGDLGMKEKAGATIVNPLEVEIASAPREVEQHGQPTGADNIETAVSDVIDAAEGDDVWYTIQGIRVAEPSAPGVYIHNGKKVLVK